MNESDFLAIFQEELEGELKRATDFTLQLENKVGDKELLQSLMREFHTIKGAARAIQYNEIKDTAHHLEDIYHGILEGKVEQRPVLIDLTFYTIDLIKEILAKCLSREPLPDYEALQGLVESYMAGENPPIPSLQTTSVPTTKADLPPPENTPLTNSTDSESINPSDHETAIPEDESNTPGESSSINAVATEPIPNDTQKVSSTSTNKSSHSSNASSGYQSDEELMDKLFNLSGELIIAASSFDPQRDAMRKVAVGLAQLQRQLNRDGTHHLSKNLQHIMGYQSEALDLLDSSNNRMRILSEELEDYVNTARLVPLDVVFSNYPRMVRDLAKELGKNCELTIAGEGTRIDHGVLEAVKAPLLHIIRNAIDHGLEASPTRQRLGKDPTGKLVIQALQLGSQIQIRIQDDGAGIDMNAIKQKVLQRGDTTEQRWEAMDLFEQQQFLFLPGFSTSNTVTEISGRGVGLDIVKSDVERVGGRVMVESEVGQGTAFILELPLTLSMTRCLLVEGGKHPFFGVQHYAFPENDIVSVIRIQSSDIRLHEGKETVRVGGKTLALYNFSALMGLTPLKEKVEEKYVLILGDSPAIALVVEAVVEEQAIVRRRFDERLGKLPNIDGVSLLRNGTMALIVDIKDLYLTLSDPATVIGDVQTKATGEEDIQLKQILVVEDSQTVREVEKHFLESAGYEVATAIDGVDGFNKIRTNNFDLVISDIDMPRMNGIELIGKIRQDEKYNDLPVIVVSYKDRDEDKQKALRAGANYYVVKSEFDTDTMLERISSLLLVDSDNTGESLLQ